MSAGRRRDACPRGAGAHLNETRCKRRDGARAGETCRRNGRNPQAMGGWEVAALFLRICSGGLVFSPCKNSDATRGRASTPGRSRGRGVQVAPRARYNMQSRDGWAVGETERTSERGTANVTRARNRGSAAAAHRDCVVRRRLLSRERPVRTALLGGKRAQLLAELRDHFARLFLTQLLGQFTRDGDEAGHD